MERDRVNKLSIHSQLNYDFSNNYLYLYLAIWQIILSGFICIQLSGKFYYLELSVSGYPQILLSKIICIWLPTNFAIRAYDKVGGGSGNLVAVGTVEVGFSSMDGGCFVNLSLEFYLLWKQS